VSAALARQKRGSEPFQLSAHKKQLGKCVTAWMGVHLGYDILALRISELTPLATREYQLGRCRPTATLMERLNSAESDTACHTCANASASVSEATGGGWKRRAPLTDNERAHLHHCQVHMVHLQPSNWLE
jgi:hypothetical protein